MFLAPLPKWMLASYFEMPCPGILWSSLLACKKAQGTGSLQTLLNLQKVVPANKLAHQAAILHPY